MSNTIKALTLSVSICMVVVGTHITTAKLIHNPVLATLCANVCLLMIVPTARAVIRAIRRTSSHATTARMTPTRHHVGFYTHRANKRWITIVILTGLSALLSGQLILQYAPTPTTLTVRNVYVLDNAVLTAFLLLFTSIFLAPVTEEYIYRFVLQKKIATYVAPGVAIVISAVSFSLSHGTLSSNMAVLLVGFLFAIIFHVRGSLLAVTTAHILYNIYVNLSHYVADPLGLDGLLNTLSAHPLGIAVTSTIIVFTIISLVCTARPMFVQE